MGGGWVGRLREAGCNHADSLDPEAGEYMAVYNCGISGDKIADLLARIDAEAQVREPSVIVLAIGINDVPHGNYSGTSSDDFETAYNELINKAKRYADVVIVVTPTNVDESRQEHDYRNGDIEHLVAVVRACADRFDLPIVDVFGSLTNEELWPDGLHPGPDGHEKLYAAIAPTILQFS
jgi:lysophospholipase L1-like esterase